MKNLFKRTLSILLAVMMLSGIGIIAGAETAETVEIIDGGYTDSGIEWSIDSEGHLRLSGEGAMFYISPQRPADVPWFLNYREEIKKVTIGYGITDIGRRAFYGCTNIESVSIPVSVTRINDMAFNNCQSLDNVVLPSTVTYIGNSAFTGCTSLSSIIIPKNVSTIGDCAFYRSGLTSLGICSDRTVLGERAFAMCENLETITLSVSESSDETAFNDSYNVKTVNYTGTEEEWNVLPFVTDGYNDFGLLDVNFNSDGVRYIEKMLVSAPPQKMVYKVGEELELTGMELTVEWNDGTIEKVTDLSKIKAWGYDSSYSNNATVVFEYLHNPVNFYIPIVSKSTTEIVGSCGPNSRWVLNIEYNGRMVITDEGDLYEFDSPEKYPWNEWSSQIFFLLIDETVSYIGDNAFVNSVSLYSVDIFGSETVFGDNVFGNGKSIKEVRFYGTLEEWKNLEIGENNDKLYRADEYYFNDELHIHSYTETVIAEATCTKTGSALYECECGCKYTDEIPMAEHQIKTVTVSATCTQDGKEYDFCEACENTIGETTVISAEGHTVGEWESDESGRKVRKCTVCGTAVEATDIMVDNTPQPTESEVNYGDSIVLDSGITGTLPEGAYIVWTAGNGNFDMEVSEDGKTCTVTSVEDGETTFTATVYDANGNVIEETSQTLTSNAGIFEKIADFFERIFGFLLGLFK